MPLVLQKPSTPQADTINFLFIQCFPSTYSVKKLSVSSGIVIHTSKKCLSGMNCVPPLSPNSYVKALTLNATVFVDSICKEVIKVKRSNNNEALLC